MGRSAALILFGAEYAKTRARAISRRNNGSTRPASVRWIFAQLKSIVHKLNRLERQISQPPRPWQSDGCRSYSEWAEKFPERKREVITATNKAAYHRRSGLIRSMGGGWTAAEWLAHLHRWGHACAYCGITTLSHRTIVGQGLTADHVVAVTKGGVNSLANVVPACRWCNTSKSNSDVVWWAARKGLALHPSILAMAEQACRRTSD